MFVISEKGKPVVPVELMSTAFYAVCQRNAAAMIIFMNYDNHIMRPLSCHCMCIEVHVKLGVQTTDRA